jgi:hypothetical protein
MSYGSCPPNRGVSWMARLSYANFKLVVELSGGENRKRPPLQRKQEKKERMEKKGKKVAL